MTNSSWTRNFSYTPLTITNVINYTPLHTVIGLSRKGNELLLTQNLTYSITGPANSSVLNRGN